jgi:hypothetical protein
MEILGTVNVVTLFVDDAVPIEKQRQFHS